MENTVATSIETKITRLESELADLIQATKSKKAEIKKYRKAMKAIDGADRSQAEPPPKVASNEEAEKRHRGTFVRRIRNPRPGQKRRSPAMATNVPHIPRRWADRRLTRVVGTAGLNDPALETEEVHGMAGEIGETTTTFIRICASSRHVIHNEEEIA